MIEQLDPKIVTRLRSASKLAAIIAVLAGLVALAGWTFGETPLESFIPGQLPIKLNTIPGFILSGISLWVFQEAGTLQSFGRAQRRLGQLAAVLVTFIGLMNFNEYMSGWGLGLDDLLFRTSQAKLPPILTRVSLPSALDFVFIGSGLLLLEVGVRAGRRASEYLGFVTLLGGMFGVMDFVFHPSVISTGIPLNSALLDCVMGGGLLCARPERGFMRLLSSRDLGGTASRRLLPAAIIVPLVFGWLMWRGLRAGLYDWDLGVMLLVVTSVATLIAVAGWTGVALARTDQERLAAHDELRDRARQEAAIARLEQQALSGGSLDTLMAASVAAVSQTLETEYSEILEFLPENNVLLLRAGVGWKPGLVGHATVSAGGESQEGCALLSGEPVVVDDLPEDHCFTASPLLREHGVVSGLSVVIPGPRRRYGVLGTHTTRHRKFSSDDVRFLQAVALMLATALERQRAEEALRHATAYNRSLIEASLDPLVTIAPDGKVTDANSAAEKITGVPRHELVGTDFSGYFTEPERARAGYQQVFREGWVQDYELAIRHRDGHIVPVLYNASIYRDEAGQVAGVFAAARDISERKRAEREMGRLNRALRTLSDCNEVIVRAREERELLYGVCGILVKVGGYRMAWVGYAEQDAAKTVRPVASAGIESGYLKTARVTWADAERGRGPTGRAIRMRQPSIGRNAQRDPEFAVWREEARRCSYASSIGLPLFLEDETLGALTLYSESVDAFDEREVALLTELAQDLSFGIRALRTRLEQKWAEAELRQLSARLLHLRDEEQRRIARELHDSIGQSLAALGMNLAWIQQQAVGLSQQTHHLLTESTEIVNRCTQEVRDFSYLLHPPTLEEYGLASAVRWYVEGFARRSGIRTTLDAPEDIRRLSQDKEIALFRVVQECLTNVYRHSGSPTARVRIVQEPKSLSVEIADEGRGFQSARLEAVGGGRRLGVGIVGMRERMSNLGGRLEISSDGRGTTVRARLPLEENET